MRFVVTSPPLSPRFRVEEQRERESHHKEEEEESDDAGDPEKETKRRDFWCSSERFVPQRIGGAIQSILSKKKTNVFPRATRKERRPRTETLRRENERRDHGED